MAEAAGNAQAVKACPICESRRLPYVFSKQGQAICRCEGCGLLLLNPQPSDALLERISAEVDLGQGQGPEGLAALTRMKRASAELYLDALLRYHGRSQGRLLEIGCGRGEFLAAAQSRGFQVEGLELSEAACTEANAALGGARVRRGDLGTDGLEDGAYDVCALFDGLGHVRDPVAALRRIRDLLKPDGTLFMVVPSLDSPTARLLRQEWMEFNPKHLHYFSTETLRLALDKAGFGRQQVGPNTKALTFEYIHHRFKRFPVRALSGLVSLAHAVLPRALSAVPVRMVAGGMNVLARPATLRPRPLLSIIVPVYNEKATFRSMMETLLQKRLEGVDREILLVESRSTDGTRDEVLKYQGHPEVRILLEEQPKGKGHAVRTGLDAAQGDIVIIQDADLEYDVEDYDELLRPILEHRSAFVLGSRHSGSWKIRVFTDQPLLTATANMAHLFFAFLLNTACGTRLRDPFTMYKVFRRDCIWDLVLKGDRFDFDWEIVIKLLRKGFQPMEVPVNYRSRSWGEGKKIRIFRDPPTWVWALLRFRLGRLTKD